MLMTVVSSALAGCARTVVPEPSAAALIGFFSDTAPPAIVGIRLGDSAARVREVLGNPTTDERITADARQSVYWPRGIVVVTTGGQGVALIGLVTPAAPQLEGVRVGDPVTHMVQQWGPAHRRDSGRASYKAGRWGVLVVIDTAAAPARIESVTLGWANASQSAITPLWSPAP
jgi:hypothetical protein